MSSMSLLTDRLPCHWATAQAIGAIDEQTAKVLEDVDICVSQCAPYMVNGADVRSGVIWIPDGVSCHGFDPFPCS